jgi:hypothetical protein
MTGIRAPEGDNPYEEMFSRLPYAEMIRLIEKNIESGKGRSRTAKESKLNFTELQRLVSEKGAKNGDAMRAFLGGDKYAYSRKALLTMQRILILIDQGAIVKRHGKVLLLYDPPEPPKPEMRFHVAMDVDRHGRLSVKLARSEPLPAQKPLPNWFRDFSLPTKD